MDDLFADEVESTSDDQVKEINDILEHAIELSSTVPCFNPLKERDLPSSFKGGTDVDHDDTGKRRLRSNSGKDPEVALLSDPMTEVATEQMSVPRRRQQDGDQKVHSFDPEANLRKQKKPQFTVEELRAEPHKLIGRKLKRFFTLILLPKSWVRKELAANFALLEGPFF